jgi:hypothetical protein
MREFPGTPQIEPDQGVVRLLDAKEWCEMSDPQWTDIEYEDIEHIIECDGCIGGTKIA